MSKTNFGGSLLPSHGRDTHVVQEGRYGKLQVRPINEIEEHGLFYLANPVPDRPELKRGWTMLAMHPNGYSCKELADRILKAWASPAPKPQLVANASQLRALEQFRYILDCGGLGRKEADFFAVVEGKY